ncbi:opacity family porin [Basilea psittacipulmonis]|uniref:opacity family porin n=1 Tax=Basilea psittacipulmonis TaxID=1472345 RepID=UPI00068B664A|nr:opacity family porin [Basilea psittacipulmonis]
MKKLILVSAVGLAFASNVAVAQSGGGIYVSTELGWSYISGKGHGSNNFSNESRSGSGSNFSPRLSVGYDFGQYRIAVDYTDMGKAKKSEYKTGTTLNADEWKLWDYFVALKPSIVQYKTDVDGYLALVKKEVPVDVYGWGKVKAQSLGVSFFYDFDLDRKWTPYVGVRASLNRVKAEANITAKFDDVVNALLEKAQISDKTVKFSDSKTKTLFGLGLIAGTQYHLTNNLSLDASIEYNKVFGSIRLSAYNDYSGKIKLEHNIATRVGVTYRF